MSPCPICQQQALPRTRNAAFPFCSARCKTVDLGKWLDEEYRIPVKGSEIDEPLEELRDALDEKPGAEAPYEQQ